MKPLPALSVIGLGKLGSPFAAVMAAKGFRVTGVDKNPRFVQAINNGRAPVDEPFLQAFLRRGRPRLSATRRLDAAVAKSDVSFIIVPTPSLPEGGFTNRFVLEAVRGIGRALREKKGRHVVVVTSTVMPGSSDGEIRAALEKASGLAVGQGVGYAYNPEFIALGSVITDMLFPDFVLIGESDARTGKLLAGIYRKTCGKDARLARMSPINAEIAKLAVNTFVTSKISYANMLAEICEQLPGADVDAVTRAAGLDSRIGGKYLKGAAAFGGPCFPRDNLALAALARKAGVRPDLPKATDAVNARQADRILRLLRRKVEKGGVIGLAGMAYKPGTPVIERSMGVDLARRLLRERYGVRITDPLAAKEARKELKGRVGVADSIQSLARHADALVVLTPAPQFAKLGVGALSARRKPLLIVDCWRLYKDRNLGRKADLAFLGRGPVGD